MLFLQIMNLKLRKKMFLIYVCTALIPLVCLTYYSYTMSKKQLEEQQYKTLESTIEQTNQNLQNKLKNYSAITSYIYINDPLRNYLSTHYTNDIEYIDAYHYINQLFKGILALNSDVDSAVIYTANSTLPSDGEFIQHITKETVQQNWFKNIMKSSGQIQISPVYLNKDRKYIFSVSRKLNFSSIEYPYGILIINIPENELYSLIEKNNEKQTIYITDEHGTVLSAKEKKVIGKPIKKLIPLNDISINEKGSFTTTLANKESLVVYAKMKNGWVTYAIVPVTRFLKDTHKTTFEILSFALISAVIALLLIYITTRFFMRRIEWLYQAFRRVEKGDFNFQPGMFSNDEIGLLSKAFANMAKQLKQLIQENYEKEVLKKEAEMNMMQAQINPHFLYNTLSSISSLALINKDVKIYQMVQHLSKFYRTSLSKGKNIITIKDEIELTKHYVYIQQTRFQDLIHLHYDIDEALNDCQTVKLILQPFVENSINHGMNEELQQIEITIRCYQKGHLIYLEIKDNGSGMNQETVTELETSKAIGYGIRNVNERIKLFFGDQYGVHIESKKDEGTKVQIVLPIQKQFI